MIWSVTFSKKAASVFFILIFSFLLFLINEQKSFGQFTNQDKSQGDQDWINCKEHSQKEIGKILKFEIKMEKMYVNSQTGYFLGFEGGLMEEGGVNEKKKISTHFYPGSRFVINGEKTTLNDVIGGEGIKNNDFKPGSIVIIQGKFMKIDKDGAVQIELESMSTDYPKKSGAVIDSDKNYEQKSEYPEVTEEEVQSSNVYNYENELDDLRKEPSKKIGKTVIWRIIVTSVDSEGNTYAFLFTDTSQTNPIKLKGGLSKYLKKDGSAFIKGEFLGLDHETINSSGYESQINFIELKLLALKNL